MSKGHDLREPTVEVLKSPSARGSKRPHPKTPPKPKPAAEHKEPSEAEDAEDEPPKVLRASDMSKLEKEKVRRIVTPKQGSGNLEVPENIFEMWKDAGKGRDNLFRMWAKSGGVKAGGQIILESISAYLYAIFCIVASPSWPPQAQDPDRQNRRLGNQERIVSATTSAVCM